MFQNCRRAEIFSALNGSEGSPKTSVFLASYWRPQIFELFCTLETIISCLDIIISFCILARDTRGSGHPWCEAVPLGVGNSRQQPAYPQTRHNITEDPNPHQHRCESLRPHKQMIILLGNAAFLYSTVICPVKICFNKIQNTKNPIALNKRVF